MNGTKWENYKDRMYPLHNSSIRFQSPRNLKKTIYFEYLRDGKNKYYTERLERIIYENNNNKDSKRSVDPKKADCIALCLYPKSDKIDWKWIGNSQRYGQYGLH